MKAIEVAAPGEPLEVVERELPEPGPEDVRIEVEACGICNGDVAVTEEAFPGISYPRTPGHEVAGRIDTVGERVTEWEQGDRVSVGWHGGHCLDCHSCRPGDFTNCSSGQITGITTNIGYAEYMTAPREALAAIPDGVDPVMAGALVCAGLTAYNAPRNTDAQPGDTAGTTGWQRRCSVSVCETMSQWGQYFVPPHPN